MLPGQPRHVLAMVLHGAMTIELRAPGVAELSKVVDTLRGWQDDGAPRQLHPGDLGWAWRFGAEATATATRTWHRDGQVVAAGLLDGQDVLRLTIEPSAYRDEELAHHLAADLSLPERGVLGQGRVNLEAPVGALVRDLLAEAGWVTADPWTPLQRDLAKPVDDPGIRIAVVGPEHAEQRTAVQRASFDGSTFTVERWHAMATGSPYASARCLVGYDEQERPVSAVTVWSAGRGKPGLIEPLGVHHDHRGHGYGRAITVAASAALRDLGSSSAIVCTPSSNVGAVATYRSAGFQQQPEVHDLLRQAEQPAIPGNSVAGCC